MRKMKAQQPARGQNRRGSITSRTSPLLLHGTHTSDVRVNDRRFEATQEIEARMMTEKGHGVSVVHLWRYQAETWSKKQIIDAKKRKHVWVLYVPPYQHLGANFLAKEEDRSPVPPTLGGNNVKPLSDIPPSEERFLEEQKVSHVRLKGIKFDFRIVGEALLPIASDARFQAVIGAFDIFEQDPEIPLTRSASRRNETRRKHYDYMFMDPVISHPLHRKKILTSSESNSS
ncbi:hypothetical protein F5146DRAFT_1152103 [Armillaria mellea]|nr:hypothetical protein F5146DRAFT_1152103 [Armillaria mellea]